MAIQLGPPDMSGLFEQPRPEQGGTEQGGTEQGGTEQNNTDGWSGLATAASIGLFFAVDRLGDGASWLPMSEFADHPDGLNARVAAVGDSPLLQAVGLPAVSQQGHRLQTPHRTSPNQPSLLPPSLPASPLTPSPSPRRTVPETVRIRIAASIAYLGVAARLVSPGIGAVLTTGIAPVLNWDDLYWRPSPTGILPLGCGPVSGRGNIGSAFLPDSTAVVILRDTVGTATLHLGEAVAARYGLSHKVVRGNLGSAIAGAATTVTRSGRCSQQAAVGLARALLVAIGLAGSGTFRASDGRPAHFRRNSCCLLYRAGIGRCEDCVLFFGRR